MEFSDISCDYSHYRNFYVVAKSCSFSKAAKILFLTQPTISYSINKLEKQLGFKLFYRNLKETKLTPEGSLLFKYVETAHNLLIEGEKSLNSIAMANKGEINIGMPVNYCKEEMLALIEKFKAKHPNILIRIVLRSRNELIDMLNNYKIDLLFGFWGSIEEKNRHNNIVVKPLTKIDLCIISSQEKDVNIPLNELSFVLPTKKTTLAKHIAKYFIDIGVTPKTSFEVYSNDLNLELIQKKFGVGVFYKKDVKQLIENGELFEINCKQILPPIQTCYAYKVNYMDYTTKLFLDFIEVSIQRAP